MSAPLFNGRPATVDELAAVAVAGYGHFTTLRVTDGHTRGLTDHLARLAEATRRLFDTDLDSEFVRHCLRRGVPSHGTTIARVTLVGTLHAGGPIVADVLVTTRDAVAAPQPVRLRSTAGVRTFPETKHLGTFAQHRRARQARTAGYDDALFVTRDGLVSETSVCNIGFVDATGAVVWPRAPMLAGVTQALVTRGLARLGAPTHHRPVDLAEVSSFAAAFVANAGSLLRPVSVVDNIRFPARHEAMDLLRRAYESTPAEPV